MLTKFEKQVLEVVKKIPRGKVVTYGWVARQVGRPKAFRAVGNALKKNPQLIKIPCHRVVKSSGEVGDYILGQKRKVKILRQEGIKIVKGKIKDFNIN